MPKMIFINLPVANIASSTRFYEAIGCRKNVQFSDAKASSMIWSDEITFQLLARKYFQTFTSKPVAEAQATCQVLLCLTRDSRGRGCARRVCGESGRQSGHARTNRSGFSLQPGLRRSGWSRVRARVVEPDAVMQPAGSASA
jgi:predicted lactoylglutathione lyase